MRQWQQQQQHAMCNVGGNSVADRVCPAARFTLMRTHTNKPTRICICTVYSVAARSSAAKNKGRKSNNANAFSFSRLYWVAYCQALLHPHSECVFVLGKCFVWFERVCVRANVALVCMCGVIQVDMFTYSLFRLVRCAGVLLLCLPGIAA